MFKSVVSGIVTVLEGAVARGILTTNNVPIKIVNTQTITRVDPSPPPEVPTALIRTLLVSPPLRAATCLLTRNLPMETLNVLYTGKNRDILGTPPLALY